MHEDNPPKLIFTGLIEKNVTERHQSKHFLRSLAKCPFMPYSIIISNWWFKFVNVAVPPAIDIDKQMQQTNATNNNTTFAVKCRKV